MPFVSVIIQALRTLFLRLDPKAIGRVLSYVAKALSKRFDSVDDLLKAAASDKGILFVVLSAVMNEVSDFLQEAGISSEAARQAGDGDMANALQTLEQRQEQRRGPSGRPIAAASSPSAGGNPRLAEDLEARQLARDLHRLGLGSDLIKVKRLLSQLLKTSDDELARWRAMGWS